MLTIALMVAAFVAFRWNLFGRGETSFRFVHIFDATLIWVKSRDIKEK